MRKFRTLEEIVFILRQAEAMLAQGKSLDQIHKALNIPEQTFYRWWKKYRTIDVTDIRRLNDLRKNDVRLKELSHENIMLKRVVADLALDKAILIKVLRHFLSTEQREQCVEQMRGKLGISMTRAHHVLGKSNLTRAHHVLGETLLDQRYVPLIESFFED